MISNVSFCKVLPETDENHKLLGDIAETEMSWAEMIDNPIIREKLFPAICVWGRKGDVAH